MLGRQVDWVLPPLVQWGWWTISLYLCGVAAWHESFETLPSRLAGMFGFTMVLAYYATMGETYLGFVPTNADNPDFWPTVYLAVNLVGPIVLIGAGCAGATIQRGR